MLTFSFAMTIALVFPKNLSQPRSIRTASPICEKRRLSSVSGLREVRFCLDLLLTTLPFSSMSAQTLTRLSNAKIWSKPVTGISSSFSLLDYFCGLPRHEDLPEPIHPRHEQCRYEETDQLARPDLQSVELSKKGGKLVGGVESNRQDRYDVLNRVHGESGDDERPGPKD